MQEQLINFVMYIIYIPIVIIIHELGHALFVVLFGKEVREIQLGFGKDLFRIKKFVVKRSIGWNGGYCSWENIDSLAWYKKILIFLGGIILNLVTATLVWIFGDVQYADWYRSFIILSYFIAVINLFPFKFKSNITKIESDGLQCIKLLNSMKQGK